MQILIEGSPSSKLVHQLTRVVIPFIGIDTDSQQTRFGIGYTLTDNQIASFWEPAPPVAVIRTWRAMKILEAIDVIEADTPRLCFCIATNAIHNVNNPQIKILSDQIEGLGKLQEIRYQALDSFPDNGELGSILFELSLNNIPFDVHEIEDGIRTGRIEANPVIQSLLSERRTDNGPKNFFMEKGTLARRLLTSFTTRN